MTVVWLFLKSWGSKLVLDHSSTISPLLILGAILRLNTSIEMVTQILLERVNNVVSAGWSKGLEKRLMLGSMEG